MPDDAADDENGSENDEAFRVKETGEKKGLSGEELARAEAEKEVNLKIKEILDDAGASMEQIFRLSELDLSKRKILISYPIRNEPGLRWGMEDPPGSIVKSYLRSAGRPPDGKIAVITYPKNFGRFEGWLHKYIGGTGEIRRPLDPYGTDIWLMCDGRHTVLEICTRMFSKYHEEIEPVFPRIKRFLEILVVRGLVILAHPNRKDEILEEIAGTPTERGAEGGKEEPG